jgi:hypothetical protein
MNSGEALHKILKKFPASLRSKMKNHYLSMQILKWRIFKSQNQSKKVYDVRVLVVDKLQYCYLSKIAILSFLYFHKDSVVTIVCDKTTQLALTKIFRSEIRNKSVKVELGDFKSSTWQGAKIELISTLNPGTGLYFDADLRFNGILNLEPELTFFVREFQLENLAPYLYLKSFWSRFDLKSCHFMLNTSMIYNGDVKNSFTNYLDKDMFSNFERELESEFLSADLSDRNKRQIWRLREQLYLSLIAQKSGLKIKFLKEQDARLDGGIVESSYFGSTGLGF